MPRQHLSYVPKLVTVFREGYTAAMLRADLIAGLTVAIVAIPLSMALAIASGLTPDKGLITVVTAGFLISLLSGSRYQIGGPAGAFVVIVYGIVQYHGFDGLVLATFMAGLIMIAAGAARLGQLIRYVPEPVIVGFTCGIAVIIASSQVSDALGLKPGKLPGDFIGEWVAFWNARDTYAPAAVLICAAALAVIVALRRYVPKFPAFLAAVAIAALAAWALHFPVETIGSKFGEMPRTLPAPHIPEITPARLWEMLPSALIIAFLAGLESLLCAVVADSMTGRKHRSNAELVGQGIANAASALFGGMPATGTIARTATNIRAGAQSPVSGIIHALIVFLCMLAFAPLASYIPLASLAAVLFIVCWNMAEKKKFVALLRGPIGDAAILLLTFGLTIFVNLTAAIAAGVALTALFELLKTRGINISSGFSRE